MHNVRRKDDRTRGKKLNINKILKNPNMFMMITERNIIHAEKKKKEETKDYRRGKKKIFQENLV